MDTDGRLDDACWIWAADAARRPNLYAAFRLRFDLPPSRCPEPARVRVSAGDAYLLYVNGRQTARGPVRSWPRHAGIDTVDVAPALVPGRNVVTALVHCVGVDDCGAYPGSKPGFLLQGTIGDVALSTGVAAWETCTPEFGNPHAPRISLYAGFNFDADLSHYVPEVWTHGRDEADWRPAAAIANAVAPRSCLEPRGIPALRETWPGQAGALPEMRLCAAGTYAPCADTSLSRAESMVREGHAGLDPARLTVAGDPWPVTIRAGTPVYLLLDATRPICGLAALDLEASGGEELRIGYSDYCMANGRQFPEWRHAANGPILENAVLTLDPRHGGANNSVDRLVLKPGVNRWDGLFNLRGFRYLKLSFAGLRGTLRIRSVRPIEVVYPAGDAAGFTCSDPQLNAIWNAALLTARNCMGETFMDNPSRERQQYGGDGYLQGLYAFEFFGDRRLWRQFLRQYARGMRADRAMQSGGPWCWNQIIPAWTLLWISSIREFAKRTGDLSVAPEHADAVADALFWFGSLETADGSLAVAERLNWADRESGVLWNFIDWQGVNGQLRGEPARLALNGFYALALEDAAWIMDSVCRAREAREYRDRRERVIHAMQRAAEDPSNTAAQSEHALVAATLAGAVSGRLAAVAERAARGRPESDIMFLFFTLQALEQEGHEAAVIACVRRIFGPLLEAGYATFPETRNARQNPSRAACQAIGAVAGYFLPRILCGLREIDPAGRYAVIRPSLCGLDWAELNVARENGAIGVRVRQTPDGPCVASSLPENMRAFERSPCIRENAANRAV